MLKKRIIPIVLIDGFSVLKTINFVTRRNLGSPITVMRTYNTRNVDELIILDIDATKRNEKIDRFLIKEISDECYMPLTVGGGITNLKDIEDLLKSGADKVSINSEFLRNHDFMIQASNEFGSQCIVASIDIKKEGSTYKIKHNNSYFNATLEEYIQICIDNGVGEILINSIDNDGMMQGFDIDLSKNLKKINDLPIIFAGGCGSLESIRQLGDCLDNIDALGISSLFHFTNYTPDDCRKTLKDLGYPVRC